MKPRPVSDTGKEEKSTKRIRLSGQLERQSSDSRDEDAASKRKVLCGTQGTADFHPACKIPSTVESRVAILANADRTSPKWESTL